MSCAIPHLPLLLSRSPLLPSLTIANKETDSLAAIFMKNNMPNLCFDNMAYTNRTEKELPPLSIPAKQIISLLNLLERMDNDVTSEVQRVKEGIKEAYVLVDEYKQERGAKEWKKRQE